jgi:hypothetical protein
MKELLKMLSMCLIITGLFGGATHQMGLWMFSDKFAVTLNRVFECPCCKMCPDPCGEEEEHFPPGNPDKRGTQ